MTSLYARGRECLLLFFSFLNCSCFLRAAQEISFEIVLAAADFLFGQHSHPIYYGLIILAISYSNV